MTTRRRPAADKGQCPLPLPPQPALRRRDKSGLRYGHNSPLQYGAELARGGHSWLERTFLELVSELGLPRPATQQVVAQRRNKIIRVDCRFPDTNMIIELLGYEHHRTRMQMENDAVRLNRLQLDGFAAMQFTYLHVVSKAPVMIETLRELLPTRAA